MVYVYVMKCKFDLLVSPNGNYVYTLEKGPKRGNLQYIYLKIAQK